MFLAYSLSGSSFGKYARDRADASWKGYREGVKTRPAISPSQHSNVA